MKRGAIAIKLRKLRGKKSMAEVAKAIGVSKSAIAMYESGKRIPKDDIKEKLSKYYNYPLVDLFFIN